MSGGSKTTTNTNSNSSTSTALPAWMTQAGQDNYTAANDYVKSGAGTWDASKAASYMNPYKSAVQTDTLNQMGLQDQNADASLADQAQAAKAYGGTRFAVQQAQQTKDQELAKSNYIDGSNAASYDQARSDFTSDRSNALQQYQTLAAVLAATPRNVTTTGNTAGTSVQQTDPGLLSTLLGAGQIAGSIWSDPRAKKDISLIERLANGLGIYRFRYLWDRSTVDPHIGVMADEVARIMPEALGPIVQGFMTVNYGKLAEML